MSTFRESDTEIDCDGYGDFGMSSLFFVHYIFGCGMHLPGGRDVQEKTLWIIFLNFLRSVFNKNECVGKP